MKMKMKMKMRNEDLNPNLVPQHINNPYHHHDFNPFATKPQFNNTWRRPDSSIERIDTAVAKDHRDLVAARESVSAWKVSQAALLVLKAESWKSLGVRMQLVPSLKRLILVEGKRMTLQSWTHGWIASPIRYKSSTAKMHISLIRQARRSESTTVNKIFDALQKKSEKKSRKRRPLLSLQKKQLDEHFSTISQHVNSFSALHGDSVGKHIKFSSSSEDDGSDDSEHEGNKNDADAKDNSKDLLQNTSNDRVSSCPHPSIAEEMSRLGLKEGMDVSASAVVAVNDATKVMGSRKRKENLEL